MIRHYKYILIIIAGFVFSFISYSSADYFETSRIKNLFYRDSEDRIEIIKTAFNASELVIESIKNYFHSSQEVSRDEFYVFTSSFFNRIEGIQALEWIPRVKFNESDQYRRNAISDGFRNFNFREMDSTGQMIPVKKRSEYYPVYYVEPFDGNENALGFDLASNPIRHKALQSSIESKKNTATQRLTLVQEKGTDFGVLLFTPVFTNKQTRRPIPDSTHNLKGFVLGVFKPRDIINQALKVLKSEGIDIYLNDKSAPEEEQELYYHKSRISEGSMIHKVYSSDFHYKSDFVFGQRNWSIACYPTELYFDSHQSYVPAIVLLVSSIISLFFLVYYHKNRTEKERISLLVTEQTNELHKFQERLSMAIDGANLGIWDWNIQTGEVHFNERWAAMLEYNFDEVEPTFDGWSKLLHPEDKEEVYETLNLHLEGKIPVYKTEHRLLTKSGHWKWILDIGKVFERDDQGKPLRATGIHLDISEIKEYQEKLLKYTSELESHIKNKDRIFSIIGHDLKSPLASILGFSEFLKSDLNQLTNDEIIEYSNYIHSAASNVNTLLQNLLEWGRIQMGKVHFSPEIYNLTHQIDDVVKKYLVVALHKKISIKAETGGNHFVFADKNMIDTVFRNLLSNAIKFTSSNGSINVITEVLDTDIKISVIDNGTGIDKEILSQIFTESLILSTPGTEGEGGTGLGLSMCKEFVEKNNGEIWIDSVTDKGTTITFTLKKAYK